KEDFTVADTSFVPLPMISIVDTTAIKQNPDFQLAQKNVDIAQANKKVEQSALWPELSAGYFVQSITGNQDIGGAPRHYDDALRFQGFTAGISLPIFFGGSLAKTKAAKITIDREKQQADYLQNQLKSQLIEAVEELAGYESLLGYYRETGEPNARKISANATKAYQNGDISYVEYVQSLDTANTILINYAVAVKAYNQTVINIQYLTNQ